MTDFDDQRQRARAAREALVGKTIAGRYLLRSLLGQGGMGAVYEAEHLGLGKRVAIKFVDPEFATDETVVARFAREARAMSAIESAHIVTVFDAGTEDGRPYLVMELLRGEDLGERLRRTKRVPLAESLHIVAQVLKGLARAHEAGIVHRDLKPDNVFLVKHDTDPLFAKIVDFGVSKIERPRAGTHPLALTGRGTVLGTPFYMSPEQAQASSDVDGRTDLYSAGAILFECLTGRPPHTGESYEQVILSICMTDAPDVRSIEPSVPAPVSAFVARALARERAQRFSSAERMLAALHEIAPAERTRVPLDPPSSSTLLSPGVEPLGATMLDGSARRGSSPSDPASEKISAATRLGVGSLSAPDTEREPSPPPESPRASPAPARARAAAAEAPVAVAVAAPAAADAGAQRRRSSRKTPAPPPKKPIGAAVATALVATMAGVGVTYGVISLLEKEPPAPTQVAAATGTTVTAATASASASASATASGAAAASASASATAPASAPVASAPPAAGAAGAAGKGVNNGSPPAAASGKLPVLPGLPASSTRPGPRPTSTKPLDIQRDLP